MLHLQTLLRRLSVAAVVLLVAYALFVASLLFDGALSHRFDYIDVVDVDFDGGAAIDARGDGDDNDNDVFGNDRTRVLLALLRAADAAFSECNVAYWLDYGSLLGAERSHSFIGDADDDADVGVLASELTPTAVAALRAALQRRGVLLVHRSDVTNRLAPPFSHAFIRRGTYICNVFSCVSSVCLWFFHSFAYNNTRLMHDQ
jgi:hypothetical protein